MQTFFTSEQNLPLTYVAKQSKGSPSQLADIMHSNPGLTRELHMHGAILFRGFRVNTETVFEATVSRIVTEKMAYIDGNSPRTSLGKGIYTSTEFPKEAFITLHNELSYAHSWPAKLYFCCIDVADEGGETPLADCRQLLQALPADLVERWTEKGLKYIRNLHGGSGAGVSWQQTFETDDRELVSKLLKKEGAQFEWNEEGQLRIEQKREATKKHPVTGEALWFNQADQFHASSQGQELYDAIQIIYKCNESAYPQHCMHGDGSPISLEDLQTIREITEQIMVKGAWQKGDFLMVDNMLVSHGRMPFKGSRRVLVAMSN